jgi:aryl-alcohol dehydrogenase-like predicted oxidoreductase
MLAVKEAGLARCIGVSEFSPRNLRIFHAICPITAVQQEWSLLNRDLESDLVLVCRELGIGIVAYSPLSRSILSDEVAEAGQVCAYTPFAVST